MVRDGCKGGIAVPGSFWGRLGSLSVWLEHLDLLVCTAGNQALVAGPAHALDHVLVRLRLPLLLPAREVPHLDNTVTTATGEVIERVGVLGERVDTVYMAGLEISKEGLRKHALHLGRIESSGVLACALEGVLVGIEVAGDLGDIGSEGLRRRRRPAEGFDLHLCGLAADFAGAANISSGLELFWQGRGGAANQRDAAGPSQLPVLCPASAILASVTTKSLSVRQ